MTLVHGHTVNGTAYEFVHLCPGIGCAVAWYLFKLAKRQAFKAS